MLQKQTNKQPHKNREYYDWMGLISCRDSDSPEKLPETSRNTYQILLENPQLPQTCHSDRQWTGCQNTHHLRRKPIGQNLGSNLKIVKSQQREESWSKQTYLLLWNKRVRFWWSSRWMQQYDARSPWLLNTPPEESPWRMTDFKDVFDQVCQP